jgi:hypothetical protein
VIIITVMGCMDVPPAMAYWYWNPAADLELRTLALDPGQSICKTGYNCIFMQPYLLSLQLLLYHSVLDFLVLKHENKNKQAPKRQESNSNFAQIPQQCSLAKFISFI